MRPPPVDVPKVIISDTDHLWGLGATVDWVWQSFCMGLCPILMDPYEPLYGLQEHASWGPLNHRDHPMWESVRLNLGWTRRYALRFDLGSTFPDPTVCSAGYCISQENQKYLAYSPGGKEFTLSLPALGEQFCAEWFDTERGCVTHRELVPAKGVTLFAPTAPSASVLFLAKHCSKGHRCSQMECYDTVRPAEASSSEVLSQTAAQVGEGAVSTQMIMSPNACRSLK